MLDGRRQGDPNGLGLLNIFTLFTCPMSAPHKDNLRDQVFKTYNDSRKG